MMMINNRKNKSKVLRLKAWGTFCFVAFTFLVYIFESRTSLNYDVYKVKEGYGYQVTRSDKIIIRQDFVPTQIGFKPFSTKQQAEKAAKMVVDKLSKKQVPALSKQEIESIIK